MATEKAGTLLRHIRRLVVAQSTRDLTDGDLLQRFVSRREEEDFAALLQRHGGLVWNVCRRVLPHEHDAEDAFQATFLVLTRKADSIRKGESVGSWLFGVARRVVMKAKQAASKRQQRESQSAGRVPEQPVTEAALHELQDRLDAEVERLPEKYRAAFVLCCLEGKNRVEAAKELGCKETTLITRLARARHRLWQRLGGQGVRLPVALAAVALLESPAKSAMPARLAVATLNGVLPAAGGKATGAISGQVAALAQGVIRTMSVTRLKMTVLLVLAFGALTGAGGIAHYTLAAKESRPKRAAATRPVAEAANSPQPAKKHPTPLDRYGDPLPARAVARLGTVRFRSDFWVSQVKVVPGGKQLLDLSSRGIILWDAATGKEVRRFEAPAWRKDKDGISHFVKIELFDLAPDGKTLAARTADTSQLDCPILLFDVATGRKLGELPGHKSGGWWGSHHPVAFVTPTLLVSSGEDKSIRVWNVATKKEVRRLETPDKGSMSALTSSPDGQYVLGTGGQAGSGSWVMWQVATGKVVRREAGLPGHFVKAALAPDGKALAVAIGVGAVQKDGGYNEVRLYSAPAWKEQRRWRTHAGQFPQRNSVTFAPDGKRIATGGADQKVRQWDTATGRAIGPAIQPYWYANNVAYLNADTLITCGSQQAIKFWDATSGKPKLDFVGSAGHLAAVAYSPDGVHVATGGGGGDSTVRIWESATGKQVAHLRGGMADVTCVQFSPDGKVIASASSDGKARLWDWIAGREVRALGDHKGWLHSVAFSPDGKQLATGDEAGSVRVWSVADGKLVHTCRGHTEEITALVFTADGRTLLSGSRDHSIRLWDLATAKEMRVIKGVPDPTGRQQPVGHTSCVTALALSPGGRRLFSGSYDHTICVWEMSSGKLCRVLKGQDRHIANSVNAISLSPDGTRLAAAIGAIGQDSSVHLWDVCTGKKIGSLPGHRGKVTKLTFSPDGRRLASASVDTTALIWDVTGLGSGATPPEAKPVAALWDELGADDPLAAYDAVCRGVAAGDAAVAVLKTKLKPVPAVDQGKVVEWVRQLDSRVFKIRERASRALADLGPGAEPLVRKAAAATESVEVRARLDRILRLLGAGSRRPARAVEVLEMIATPKAKRLLADLASGAAGARLTRDAADALKRLGR